jgi:hypothetical protein
MTKIHENKLTMYLAVDAVLQENAAKSASLPALILSITKFKELIGDIQTKSKEFNYAATGKTIVKAESEDLLMEELIPAVSAVSAYAHATGDTLLAVRTAVTEHTLRHLRDTELVSRCNGLIELAEQNLEKLGDYGITADTVASVRRRLDAYAEALGKKESGVSERASVRKTLFDLFDEADELLSERIDALMQQFRKKETQFYNEYFQARNIWNMGAPRKPKPADVAPVG